MSQGRTSATVDLQKVREDELSDIEERRRVSGVASQTETSKELAGLALSGGGIRSACFNLGLLQAIHRFGLLRFFDYLSTVSGGGYIGAHLTSSSLKGRRPFDRENFPLKEENSGHQQSRKVQRFLYGGHFLMRPWSAFNKYLIGVVLNNAAIFSFLVAVCAMTAFLWRSLDYPWFRDRAALFGLGNDLIAPFLPSILLGIAWFIAWMVSYWQRQAEAAGLTARYLLGLTGASLLIAVTLLFGNGDIALPDGLSDLLEGWLGESATVSVSSVVWTPLVMLVAVFLLPALNPKRLLRSATAPQNPVERLVFAVTSTALLVGIPLIMIGLFARENISGYSTSPERALLKADILGWPRLCSLVLQPEAEEQRQARNLMRGAVPGVSNDESGISVLLGPNQADDSPTLSVTNGILIRSPLVAAVKERLEQLGSTAQPDVPTQLVELLRTPDPDGAKLKQLEDQVSLYSSLSAQIPAVLEADSNRTLGELTKHPKLLLEFLALKIVAVSDVLAAAESEIRLAETEEERFHPETFHTNRFQRTRLNDDLSRAFAVTGYFSGLTPDNEIGRYWFTRTQQEQLQDEFIHVFNLAVLPDRSLPKRLEKRFQTWLRNRKNEPSTDDGSATVTLTPLDEDVVRKQIQQAKDIARSNPNLSLVAHANRQALEAIYPGIFRPVTDVQRRVVIYEDQWNRLEWVFGALIVFFILGVWIDINATSMHRFYRNRLAHGFLVPPDGNRNHIGLSELVSTDYGNPYHLLSGSISMFRPRLAPADDVESSNADDGDGPAKDHRWIDSFLMSRRYCGAEVTGYCETPCYERRFVGQNIHFDLAEAMAISGAAVSPSQNQNRLVAFLMFALNLRLGQWVPNPRTDKPRFRPRFFYLALNLLRPPGRRSYCFVSDGGHSENLGLVQLLKRRCRLIVVSDSGQDERHRFDDLARAVRTARVHGGVRIVALDAGASGMELNLKPFQLIEPAAGESSDQKSTGDVLSLCTTNQHFLAARIIYPARDGDPGPTEGLLLYLKPSMTGDESLDLIQYRRNNRFFPHQPTSDQMFSEADVESYRQLGYHIGEQLCQLLEPVQKCSGDLDSEFLWSDDCRCLSVDAIRQLFEDGYRRHVAAVDDVLLKDTKPKAARARKRRSRLAQTGKAEPATKVDGRFGIDEMPEVTPRKKG